MAHYTEVQLIEAFHLLFLRALSTKRTDWYVLKGGVNIRYFFESDRYSNDIDLDFQGREPWMVAKTIDGLLSGAALTSITRQVGISVAEYTSPKQTETTLRWKLGLHADGISQPVRTKIEFSARGHQSTDVVFEVVPDRIVRPYGIQSPMVQHYGDRAAIEQKIAALALRSETKARDVFDLDLLMRRRHARGGASAEIETTHSLQAAARALELSYASFVSEVIPFLDQEIAVLYDSKNEWEKMQKSVADWLKEIPNFDATKSQS